ncbi:condensation domain-containing protein [Actinomadura alba]|uniref:Condensation domain-containing protein n=1 Tax=Actinomadura alba TaxID=406431 RepID=A0ABR7LS25_9ACTN|nr:condensation domain-containing protein [Actinomadura alba]MBC6467550.1 hypothetical protein [Actinomadura alba]
MDEASETGGRGTVHISPARSGEEIPLSSSQEFLCLFDQGGEDGPFGGRYNIVCGWRVRGNIAVDVLQRALDALVIRHEALRTKVIRDTENRHQRVFPPAPPLLQIRELPGVHPRDRQRRSEELLIELERAAYSVNELPLIQARLGRFDDHDAVLVLIAHHSAVDEWSMKVAIRDLAVLYATLAGHDQPAPADVHQYREYVAWDRERAGSPAMNGSRAYWRRKLSDARLVPTHTDIARSAGAPKGTAAYRFVLGPDTTAAALALARSTRSSAFIVMLGAYLVFLRQTTGASDITVTTFASGRTQERFQGTVGPFIDQLPLRTDLTGCRTLLDVIARARKTCFEAYSHAMPFGQILQEVPELAETFAGDRTAVLSFQVFQFPFVMDREIIGDLEYSEIHRRLSQPVTTEIPDGGLWTLDIEPSGDIAGSLWYNTNLFEERTIRDMVSRFCTMLDELLSTPDAPLRKEGQNHD